MPSHAQRRPGRGGGAQGSAGQRDQGQRTAAHIPASAVALVEVEVRVAALERILAASMLHQLDAELATWGAAMLTTKTEMWLRAVRL